MSYKTNIIQEVSTNTYFRRVLFTGKKSQLVVMEIKQGEDIGEETHKNVEQTLFFMDGVGKSIINGKEEEVMAGDVVVVSPGEKHNFVNVGTKPLKIYTVYSPANHIDGRIHQSKKEADADAEDEAFGEAVK